MLRPKLARDGTALRAHRVAAAILSYAVKDGSAAFAAFRRAGFDDNQSIEHQSAHPKSQHLWPRQVRTPGF